MTTSQVHYSIRLILRPNQVRISLCKSAPYIHLTVMHRIQRLLRNTSQPVIYWCWKIAVNWHTSTVGIEPTAPPPSRSAVRRTNYCATAPFPKKNSLDVAYIMRHLLRHDSFARCYHRCCPTLLLLKTALLLQLYRLHLQPSWNPNMIPRVVPLEKVLCISPLPPMLENSSRLAHADGGNRTYGTSA